MLTLGHRFYCHVILLLEFLHFTSRYEYEKKTSHCFCFAPNPNEEIINAQCFVLIIKCENCVHYTLEILGGVLTFTPSRFIMQYSVSKHECTSGCSKK